MSTSTDRRRWLGAAALTALAVGAAACSPAATDELHGLDVYVSFAPLAYLVERLAGDGVEVTNLTAAGADPHHVELSPARIAELRAADLVVVVSGLQPAVDEALDAVEPAHVVDTLEVATAELPEAGAPPEPARDPHFWLDPVRFGLAAAMVADALIQADPDGAAGYRARAAELVTDLDELDVEIRTALEPCAGDTLVTAHEAFGYLAARYDLRQEGITGVDPEVEPSPARLRDVGAIVERTGVRTLFFETAADPGVAEQLAAGLGVGTAVLDPLERSSDPDYLSVMRTNLDALTAGLVCAG